MKFASLATAALAVALIAPAAASAQAGTYKRDLPAKLVKEAKITEAEAAAIALKSVPTGKIDKMELEKEDGKFIYSYDLKVPGKKGVQEVHVDAMTGAVVSSTYETPEQLKAEQAKEAKEAKEAKAAKPPAKTKTP